MKKKKIPLSSKIMTHFQPLSIYLQLNVAVVCPIWYFRLQDKVFPNEKQFPASIWYPRDSLNESLRPEKNWISKKPRKTPIIKRMMNTSRMTRAILPNLYRLQWCLRNRRPQQRKSPWPRWSWPGRVWPDCRGPVCPDCSGTTILTLRKCAENHTFRSPLKIFGPMTFATMIDF